MDPLAARASAYFGKNEASTSGSPTSRLLTDASSWWISRLRHSPSSRELSGANDKVQYGVICGLAPGETTSVCAGGSFAVPARIEYGAGMASTSRYRERLRKSSA